MLLIKLTAARASLVFWAALAMVLAPSIGHLAIQERDWTARGIMLGVLLALWFSVFTLAAVRAQARRARYAGCRPSVPACTGFRVLPAPGRRTAPVSSSPQGLAPIPRERHRANSAAPLSGPVTL